MPPNHRSTSLGKGPHRDSQDVAIVAVEQPFIPFADRANPPHHLTTSPNPPDTAATSMMMIVECANLLNHSYFPAVCS